MSKKMKEKREKNAAAPAVAAVDHRIKLAVGVATARSENYKSGGASARLLVIRAAEPGGSWEDVADLLIRRANRAAAEFVEAQRTYQNARPAERESQALLLAATKRRAAVARDDAAYFGGGWLNDDAYPTVRAAELAAKYPTVFRLAASITEDWVNESRAAVARIEEEKAARAESAKNERDRIASMTPEERIKMAADKQRAIEEKRAKKAAEKAARAAAKMATARANVSTAPVW